MQKNRNQTGLKLVLPLMLVTLLSCASAFSMAEDRKTTEYRIKAAEYKIKAAFLYNFSRFVTWPEEPGKNEGKFKLCTFGGDPFGQLLDALAGKSIHKSSLEINRIGSLDEVRDCQVVFISTINGGNLEYVMSSLREQPTLTVSDINGFTAHGGIIQFTLVNNKVRFNINLDAANHAGLTISSKLLSLATVVRKDQ